MNMRIFVVYCLSVFFLASCGSVNEEKARNRLEELLSIAIPNSFEVVQYKEGGLNDYTIRYDIRLKLDDFKYVLNQLDLSEWDNSYSGLHTKVFPVDDRRNEYVEIILREHIISYLYVYD